MPVLEIEFGTPAFDEALSLRNDILRIPLGLEFHAADISKEWDSHHLGIYDEANKLVGCLTLLPINNKEIKMRQVAVAESKQGKGFGKLLVQECETFCKELDYDKIVLNARKNAVPFYKKLGYKTQGKMFEEVGIPHYKMQKTL